MWAPILRTFQNLRFPEGKEAFSLNHPCSPPLFWKKLSVLIHPSETLPSCQGCFSLNPCRFKEHSFCFPLTHTITAHTCNSLSSGLCGGGYNCSHNACCHISSPRSQTDLYLYMLQPPLHFNSTHMWNLALIFTFNKNTQNCIHLSF